MLSTFTKHDTDPTLAMDYSIACWRGGWLVYKGAERRWPVASGFATLDQAEFWVERARDADADRAAYEGWRDDPRRGPQPIPTDEFPGGVSAGAY